MTESESSGRETTVVRLAMRKGFTTLGVLVLLSACSDPDQKGDGGDDAGAGGAGGATSAATGGAAGSGPVTGSGGAAPVCNDIVLAAPAVSFPYHPGALLLAEGGAI